MQTQKKVLRQLISLLTLLILLIPAACGQVPFTGGEATPASAGEAEQEKEPGAPGVIHFPEVTKKDWVSSISKLCLQVDQTYVGVSGHTEPIADEIKGVLDRIGVETTIGENAGCQANLKISLEMTPYGESVSGAGTCYFDASAQGQAILSASGEKDLAFDLIRKFSPATGYGITFVYSCPAKEEADYASAWGYAVAPMIAEWWGAPGLVSALRSDNYALSNASTGKLAELGAGADVVPVLIEMLSDVTPSVREAAARTLGRFGPAAADAVPALIKLVDDPDFGVQQQTILALGYIGDERAVPVLMGLLESSNQGIMSTACSALGAIGEKAAPAVPLLMNAVKSDDYSTASGALDALSAIGPAAKEAVPTLIEMMEMGEQSKISGWIVGNTLEDITGQKFGDDAAAWRKWYEENK